MRCWCKVCRPLSTHRGCESECAGNVHNVLDDGGEMSAADRQMLVTFLLDHAPSVDAITYPTFVLGYQVLIAG